jgi:hypothetical protein
MYLLKACVFPACPHPEADSLRDGVLGRLHRASLDGRASKLMAASSHLGRIRQGQDVPSLQLSEFCCRTSMARDLQ